MLKSIIRLVQGMKVANNEMGWSVKQRILKMLYKLKSLEDK